MNAVEAVRGWANASVEITTQIEGRYIEGRYVVVTVADKGPCVRPEMYSPLFHPFITAKADGTGLELFVVS